MSSLLLDKAFLALWCWLAALAAVALARMVWRVVEVGTNSSTKTPSPITLRNVLVVERKQQRTSTSSVPMQEKSMA